MEAAIRTAHYLVTGEELANLEVEAVRGLDGVKEAHVHIERPRTRRGRRQRSWATPPDCSTRSAPAATTCTSSKS